MWMLFLAIGIQLILGLIVAVFCGVFGINSDEIEPLFMRPDVKAIIGGVIAILAMPLIKIASHIKDEFFPVKFLCLQWPDKVTLVRILLIGLAYYIVSTLSTNALSIDTPQYMLDVKSQTNTLYDMVMLVIGVCILAPIFEEIIFRGLGYSRLVQSRLGVTGTIIVTSLIFTFIHTQYDFIIILALLPFAVLLGYVRYKTGNLIYCIVLHMQINVFSTIELFAFL